ncbi:MmcB family DNA repair protein [Phreatobacter aquaticus]|uniref:MmcB family DNA repair protein n=1 Tax=Phreatobacter aquaticus TaxID=2570229 RepID=A0A4D7QLK1_9HYPH|nr:MmcB family DNA repair protein [Phreatobacter aquaticus]QCK88660.1 MmcB family DNA repair protein [Phreatobacter aquaticus]
MDRATASLVPVPDGRQSVRALAIARGTTRLLAALDFAIVPELPLPSGRRADLTALSANGTIWIVEIKSSIEDFRADRKWADYRAHADRVLFAVAPDFPVEVLPEDAGLILADGHGAEIIREGVAAALPAPTRKVMMLRFARAAASRLTILHDPQARLPQEF